MTRGAIVLVYALSGSTVMTLQTGWPVLASSATSLPSNVPTKIFPFHAATPRLTTSQHPLTPSRRGTLASVRWRPRQNRNESRDGPNHQVQSIGWYLSLAEGPFRRRCSAVVIHLSASTSNESAGNQAGADLRPCAHL